MTKMFDAWQVRVERTGRGTTAIGPAGPGEGRNSALWRTLAMPKAGVVAKAYASVHGVHGLRCFGYGYRPASSRPG